MISLAKMLNKVAPFLSPDLVSPEAFAHVRQMSRPLPFPLSDFFGLECRLGEADGPVDLEMALNRAVGREVLAGHHPHTTLPDHLFLQPAWDRARTLCAAWADPCLPLNARVSTLWLEFDADEAPETGPPGPSLFLSLPFRRATDHSIIDYYEPITDVALPIFLGGALPEGVRQRLHACYEALPPEAHVAYIGVMVPRNTGRVRLGIMSLRAEQCFAYLKAIGWPGSLKALRHALAPYARIAEEVILCFEVGEAISPKLGMEFTFRRDQEKKYLSLAHEPRWRSLLDELVTHGLCTQAKREGCLAWNGWARTPGIAGDEAAILRFLHHVKIGYQQGKPLEAKGYIGFRYYALSPKVRRAAPVAETALLC